MQINLISPVGLPLHTLFCDFLPVIGQKLALKALPEPVHVLDSILVGDTDNNLTAVLTVAPLYRTMEPVPGRVDSFLRFAHGSGYQKISTDSYDSVGQKTFVKIGSRNAKNWFNSFTGITGQLYIESKSANDGTTVRGTFTTTDDKCLIGETNFLDILNDYMNKEVVIEITPENNTKCFSWSYPKNDSKKLDKIISYLQTLLVQHDMVGTNLTLRIGLVGWSRNQEATVFLKQAILTDDDIQDEEDQSLYARLKHIANDIPIVSVKAWSY